MSEKAVVTMHIRLICVGKLKEKYWRGACDEYLKRLRSYAKIEVIEVAEEKGEGQHDSEVAKIIQREGERILANVPLDSYVITLAIKGESLTSPQLATKLHTLVTYGQSDITFVIGGSYGLSAEVYNRADQQLSFSALTFPHQMFRVMLLEQLYRSCKINRGESYHK